jgi:hypothetical protein
MADDLAFADVSMSDRSWHDALIDILNLNDSYRTALPSLGLSSSNPILHATGRWLSASGNHVLHKTAHFQSAVETWFPTSECK